MKSPLVAVIAVFVAGGGCVSLVLVLPAILGGRLFTTPPPSALNPPVPPNAQNIAVTPSGSGGSKTITFRTPDEPETVVAFYRDVLRKDGWVNPLLRSGGYSDKIFEWHQGGPDGPTDLAYRLTIEFRERDRGFTSVLINLVQFDPR